jgi:ribosomal protein S18 acetylase RimI-like enzyme
VVASIDMSQERAVIRRAEMTDLSKVETVARATWPVAYAGIIPDEVQRRLLDRWYSRESLSHALAAQGSSFFVAESSGNVIGFAQFVHRSAAAVELTRIYVLPDRQRSGIGQRLLDAGLTECAAEGLTHLTVEVERDNVQGRRFYERAGFAEPRGYPRRARICARAGRIPTSHPREWTGQVLTVKASAPGIGRP